VCQGPAEPLAPARREWYLRHVEARRGGRMPHRKTFREKLADHPELPRVERIPKGMQKTWGVGTIVIPSPRDVDSLMRGVPKGKLLTINLIRDTLAKRHGATIACPIATGIHARIAAGAAGEAEAEGRKRVTPYWRTLKADGEVNEKYPGGLAGQRRRLESEGHVVVARGRRLFVRDFERALVRPE
jgi:alkylated DNA nucleotide flippase Atl1